MKIYLVRHGETEWNSIKKLQGQTDIPLNEYGMELARITAKGLEEIKFDRVYSSPLIRAVQTARLIIGDDNYPIITDDRLKEINFGACEGIIIPGINDDSNNPIWKFEFDTINYVPAEGGETFQDVYNRSGDFFRNEILPLEGSVENILIVGHGCMNRTIINPYLGRELKDFWKVRLDNCAISILEVKNGETTVIEASKKFYEREINPSEPEGIDSIYG